MNKQMHQLDRIWKRARAVVLACFLAVAILLAGASRPVAASEPFQKGNGDARKLPVGVHPVPPHPDLIKRLEQQGYSSATIVDMLSQPVGGGIDVPQEITTAVVGTKKALILLVDFPDMPRNNVSTPAFYNNLLFSVGTYPAPGSMRDFYRKNSYSKFDVTGSVNNWGRASHGFAYYSSNGQKGFGQYPTNAAGLVREAVLLANPVVNYANFAEGGEVKGLFVIHAGQGAEVNYPSNLIWSHKWSITSAGGPATTLDGVLVDTYTIEPEYIFAPGDSTIGVFAHEYGHALGLPDLYDVSLSSTGSDLSSWSLMAGGTWNGINGHSPASFDAWSKIQLGWITPIVLKSDVANKTIPPSYNSGVVYKLWKKGVLGKEYFLVENRQNIGFDTALPGSGLLIYHVDDNKRTTDNTEQLFRCINHSNWLCGAQHGLIALEQADGLFELEKDFDIGDAGDPFPGSTNKKNIHFTTTPNFSSYASSANTLVQVLNITKSGNNMIATMKVGVAPGFNSQFTTNAAGWKPLNGSWKITASGLYHTPGLTDRYVSSMYNANFSTLTYTVRMRNVGCDHCMNIIYFRGAPGILTWNSDWNKGYAFGYTNSGTYTIWKEVGSGDPILLVDIALSPAITDTWNILKVTAKGNFLQFFINNVLVESITDSSLSTGKVGIGVYRNTSAGNHLYVDWATLKTTAPAADESSGLPEEGIFIDEMNAILPESSSVPMAP
jgi:M6 family metalloprotease-like protein